MMICETPRFTAGKFILSAYDGVWEPIKSIPEELSPYLSDEVGNTPPSYAGWLQMIDPIALAILRELLLFSCFRAVQERVQKQIDTCPVPEVYERVIMELEQVGYDVCTGNGWRSASCCGEYPIDSIDGSDRPQAIVGANRFGLIDDLMRAVEYCRRNDEIAPEDSPWYPVAVLIDKSSLQRLTHF